MELSSRFASRSPALRSACPLLDDEIARVAPSIFAAEPHGSRSDRYTYIPTIDVLRGLRKEGFEPFMVVQTKVRNEDKREHTKHMIRLRHADQINGREANEIILLNSHDGSSAYQMLAGMLRLLPAGNSRSYVRNRTMSRVRREALNYGTIPSHRHP